MGERYIMENNGAHGHTPPLPHPQIDESLLSSVVTRKRKISKMWDAICGNYGGDSNFLAQQLFGHIGRPSEDNRQPHKEQRKDSTTKMAGWRVEDIDGGLAADFDDSLSGLGVELGTSSYNMSEALLALPTLPAFKQEPIPENGRLTHSSPDRCRQNQVSPAQSTTSLNGANSVPHAPSPHSLPHSPTYTISNSLLTQGSSPPPSIHHPNNRFQYVLAAATSIATKIHEETLTYLNQGQSYEIKLKKLGDLSDCRGKFLKSLIRVCFHERRLQYMEKEQIANWRHTRPGERILEIDTPLSYGISDIYQDPHQLNSCEFVWDPTKETGVFVRVNCISTEFTPKKHGGEKGVPFRIQIETQTQGDGALSRLHCASCQVKVFKPKGADRKHKTDREKMDKRPMGEQDKYQPSYDCTVLTECPFDSVYSNSLPAASVSSSVSQKNESYQYTNSPTVEHRGADTPVSIAEDSPVPEPNDLHDNPVLTYLQMYQQPLSADATSTQTTQWMQSNRFGSYVRTFCSFSGADVLRLSRDDLIQICGLADGIRLYNALHSKVIRPRLTLYVCIDSEQVYHAIYLECVTCEELTSKLATLMTIQRTDVQNLFMQGPSGIHVLVNDEVLRNLSDESMFTVDILQDANGEHYRLLLKSSSGPR